MYVLRFSVVFDCLQLHGLQPTRLLCPWDFLGKHPGVVVVQPFSHVRLYNPKDYSTPDFPVLHHLPDLALTHVH